MENLQNMNIDLYYSWENTNYKFPNSVNTLTRKGAVYCWVIVNKNLKKEYYFGEGKNLSKRINFYKNPGPTQDTNIRINKILKNAKDISLFVLVINKKSKINKLEIKEDCFESKSFRLMLENIVLMEARKNKLTIHNLD